MGRTFSYWGSLSQEVRDEHLVEHLDKNKFTEYFSDLVVDLPWRRNPKNSYKQMNAIKRKIESLYVIDSNLEEVARK